MKNVYKKKDAKSRRRVSFTFLGSCCPGAGQGTGQSHAKASHAHGLTHYTASLAGNGLRLAAALQG